MKDLNRRAFLGLSAGALALSGLGAGRARAESNEEERTATTVRKDEYMSEVVRELEKKWPGNRTVDIVCHGHSVPSGYFHTPVVETFNAYPHLFHRKLKERFPYAVANVIVTAIGGEESDLGAARFDEDVLTHKPDVITIDYALNDRRIGLDKARESWESMIGKAKDRGIKLILLTPTGDLRSDLDDPADPLNRHAEQIRQLAREHEVALVDSLARVKEYIRNGGELEKIQSIANHPNRKGHEMVAEGLIEWFPASEKEDGEE